MPQLQNFAQRRLFYFFVSGIPVGERVMDDITKRLRLIDPTLELRYCEDVTKLHEIGQWCHMAQGLWIEEIERLRNLLREIAFSAGRAVASGDSERIRIELLEIAFKTGRAVLGEKE